jgi:hypothetical protein
MRLVIMYCQLAFHDVYYVVIRDVNQSGIIRDQSYMKESVNRRVACDGSGK